MTKTGAWNVGLHSLVSPGKGYACGFIVGWVQFCRRYCCRRRSFIIRGYLSVSSS